MKTFSLGCMLCLFVANATATGPVEIWSYAFVTAGAQEPIAGQGSAIFKPDGTGLEGPMWSQDRVAYRLKFSLKGDAVVADLTPEKNPSGEIHLEGSATQTHEADGKGCSIQVRLVNGLHYVLLQRFVDKCAT